MTNTNICNENQYRDKRVRIILATTALFNGRNCFENLARNVALPVARTYRNPLQVNGVTVFEAAAPNNLFISGEQ